MQTASVLWTLISLFFVGLGYFAGLSFLVGLAARLVTYMRTPAPLPVALTPAPTTETGAIGRILGDVLIFPALFRSDKALWAGSWLFHVALGAILFRHVRYFTYPVPQLVLYMETVALFFGYLFGLAILFLFWRRLALPRSLYISNIPDYTVLILLGGIAVTGILVSYWLHVSIVDVKAFILGLLTLKPVAPPQHWLFLLHFLLVCVLMIYFPWSKLLHAGGIFFSPTRSQPYQVQKAGRRYENPVKTGPYGEI